MPDGTVKQVNPFTGSQVWTVPGRGNRPLGIRVTTPQPLDAEHTGTHCAFCEKRYLETPPEKSRVVKLGDDWLVMRHLPAEQLFDTVAEFRRIPNLFEILPLDYWSDNYGYEPPEFVLHHRDAYLSTTAGREHAFSVARTRALAGGMTPGDWDALAEKEKLRRAGTFFAGGHDVIVGRRHFIDGATSDDKLASSGTLTTEEHHQYTAFTISALRSLYQQNRYVRYVAVFQNWLKAAGASFDHLHKQLAAIDERGVITELELSRVRSNLNLYNEAAVNYAGYQNLVVAENEHAIAFAGFGHRYPTLEIYSKSAASMPWDHSEDEVRGMSDLLHACHAATGSNVPCNEEWRHKPPDVDVPMPWRVMLKWRVSTLAGFEGGTKVYLNTISPWTLRDRVVSKLFELRAAGQIAADISIATECSCTPNSLRYNPMLH